MNLSPSVLRWLRSGRRRALKLVATIAGARLVTAVGLMVTGIWNNPPWEDPAPPVAIHVNVPDPYNVYDPGLVPRAAQDLPPPPVVRDLYGGDRRRCPTRRWVRQLGGADAATTFTAYVEGLSNRTVILDRTEVEMVRRRPVMQGTRPICSAPPPARRPRYAR